MAVICYASDIIAGYERRESVLSNAPLRIKQDTNRIEKYALRLVLD